MLYVLLNWQFQVVEFCTEKNHNKEAPNAQNQRCNLRSTWEVIQGSEDFRQSKPMTTQPPTPTFSLLQITQRILCLVLDKSGSMIVRSLSLPLGDVDHRCVCNTIQAHNLDLVESKHNRRAKAQQQLCHQKCSALAGARAQLTKSLSCKHKDMSSRPKTSLWSSAG